MTSPRVPMILRSAVLAVGLTAFVVSMELVLLRDGGGPASRWGTRGVLLSAPVRFVLYLAACSLMHGWRQVRPPLSHTALGAVLFALATVVWVPVSLLWTVATGALP